MNMRLRLGMGKDLEFDHGAGHEDGHETGYEVGHEAGWT